MEILPLNTVEPSHVAVLCKSLLQHNFTARSVHLDIGYLATQFTSPLSDLWPGTHRSTTPWCRQYDCHSNDQDSEGSSTWGATLWDTIPECMQNANSVEWTPNNYVFYLFIICFYLFILFLKVLLLTKLLSFSIWFFLIITFVLQISHIFIIVLLWTIFFI